MSLATLESIPDEYRFDQQLLRRARSGLLGWYPLGLMLLDGPAGIWDDLPRYGAQLEDAGLIVYESLEVKLPSRTMVTLAIDEQLPQRWTDCEYDEAHGHMYGSGEPLLDYCGAGVELNVIEATQLMLLTSMAVLDPDVWQERSLASNAVSAALPLTKASGGTIPAPLLCATALRLVGYTGSPHDLFPTAAAILT